MINRWFLFGNSFFACGGLRILDCIWPPQIAPWPYYVIEVAVGLWLMRAFCPQKATR